MVNFLRTVDYAAHTMPAPSLSPGFEIRLNTFKLHCIERALSSQVTLGPQGPQTSM